MLLTTDYRYYILLSAVFFWGCTYNNDNSNHPNKDFNPTPVVLNIPFYFQPAKIPNDNPLTKEGINLGRHLFYDKILSIDSTVSCASCHKQEFAFSDNRRFSPGVNQTLGLRQSMSLVNLVLQDSSFFWDGRSFSLEHQVLFPIEDPLEMKNTIGEVVRRLQNHNQYPDMFSKAFGTTTITADMVFKAIAQFERSITSFNSKYDKYLRNQATLTPQELRGMNLFFTHPDPTLRPPLRGGNCGDCHLNVSLTDFQFRNNGLDVNYNDNGRYNITGNVADKGKFRVPHLRNIALTAPYMHDGRFNTLEEVLNHYNEGIQLHANLDILIKAASNVRGGRTLGLTEQEKADIIAFLHTLTDSTLIQNPDLKNPFLR